MEASKPLSIESFSYSWLVNLTPSFESPNSSFRASFDDSSFIEMDPKLSPSKRFIVVHQDFDFDLGTLQPPLTVVHADELISNGILVPLFLKQLDPDSFDSSSCSAPATPVSSVAEREARFYRKSRSFSIRKCQGLPKRIIRKYLDMVRPFWLKMRRSRIIRDCAASPAQSLDICRRSCDSESSIYEAVLHCKKTIGAV